MLKAATVLMMQTFIGLRKISTKDLVREEALRCQLRMAPPQAIEEPKVQLA